MTVNTAATVNEEIALRIVHLKSLLALRRLHQPTPADYDRADARTTARSGDIVIVRDGLRYARVASVNTIDGRVLACWITNNALAEARKRLLPEMLRSDYADVMGQDARHGVIARWTLAQRLLKLTDGQRADAGHLHTVLGAALPYREEPVHFVRQVLADYEHDLRRYGSREEHARVAFDAIHRPALLIQRVAAAFPQLPEVALAATTGRMLPRDAVRVVPTAR